jgi:hypothetical protein
MSDYQIRVFKDNARVALVWVSPSSTFAALHRVREFAQRGHTLEVWRNDECVHREVIDRSGQ